MNYNPPWIQIFHAAAEDGVVRWLVPANNRLSHFRRDENLKKERIKNKTSHMLQAKNNSFLCKLCYIFCIGSTKLCRLAVSKKKKLSQVFESYGGVF